MDERYSAADIRVIGFDEHVRSTPSMYFGAHQGDPHLATEVLCGVPAHALDPGSA